MATFRDKIKPKSILEQLDYWRNIRLDCPARKAEAMANIDRLLEELEADSGPEA